MRSRLDRKRPRRLAGHPGGERAVKYKLAQILPNRTSAHVVGPIPMTPR